MKDSIYCVYFIYLFILFIAMSPKNCSFRWYSFSFIMMDKSTTLLHNNMMLYNLIDTVHWSSGLYSWTVDW